MPINLTSPRMISLSADGRAGWGESYAATGTFSADGRQVLFWTDAEGLAPDGSSALIPDLLAKDVASGEVLAVNRASDGGRVHEFEDAAVSPDWATLAFVASAAGFVPGGASGWSDVLLLDRASGAVTLASAGPDGAGADGPSFAPLFSPDGGKVAFLSRATNLAPAAGNDGGNTDLFVRDLASGEIERVSVPPAGGRSNGTSSDPVFSPDGRLIAFISDADDLVPGTPAQDDDRFHLFTADLGTGEVRRVAEASPSQTVAFSPDGRWLAFESPAALAPGADPERTGLFLADLGGTDGIRYVAPAGAWPAFTPDGRHLLFSGFDPIVPRDADERIDLHAYDLEAGTVARLDLAAADWSNPWGGSYAGGFSPDGRWLAVSTDAAGLAAEDDNYSTDVFVYRTGGTRGDDRLLAFGGERVAGRAGADDLVGSAGSDALIGGTGDDAIAGRRRADALMGGNGDDDLDGGAGLDVLRGGAGADRLFGGRGDDRLRGGEGADAFVFRAGGGHDLVTGFEDGVDLLVLEGWAGDAAAALAGARARGAGVALELGQGAGAFSVVLRGLDLAALDESDFLLVA